MGIPAVGRKSKDNIKRPLHFFGPCSSKAIDERMEKVSEFTQMLNGQNKPKYSPFKKLCIQELENSDPFEFTVPSSSKGLVSERKKIMADAAYELTDDNFDVDVPEKLSTYRKKRLAEKKYEFIEEDESVETFVPLTRQRLKKMSKESTKEDCSKSRGDVLVCVSERISPD